MGVAGFPSRVRCGFLTHFQQQLEDFQACLFTATVLTLTSILRYKKNLGTSLRKEGGNPMLQETPHSMIPIVDAT